MSRRKDFTFIELLVVIAIIGILASMVFPVSARARESARKAVCLSNVKNITLAVQMYLADNNDTFPPGEHRQEVLDFFELSPGGGGEGCGYEDDEHRTPEARAQWSNPYLRWPVVLDEYVKNRDVWNCPSAKIISTARFIIPMADWMGYLRDTQGMWGDPVGTGPCYENVFPSGWGGTVTDSMTQMMMAGPGTQGAEGFSEAHKVFTMGLSTAETNFNDMKMVSFQDVAHVPVVADGGLKAAFISPATIAYPDICCPECAGIAGEAWSGWISVDCPDGTWCPECADLHAPVLFTTQGQREEWKPGASRHLGGTNIGWADGHASWIHAQRVCSMTDEGDFEGIGLICDGTSVEGYRANCGDPPAGMDFLFSKATY